MDWARIRPQIQNWPAGADEPPVFVISADGGGEAVVELAWDPQALLAPANYPDEPLRYYSTNVRFDHTFTDADGQERSLSVPAQSIDLGNASATWQIPEDLWDAYEQEALKGISGDSDFPYTIYYRVRVTPSGSSNAVIWPPDSAVRGNRFSPHVGILALSGSPVDQAVPDEEALEHAGGIPVVAPNLWADIIRWCWQNLPDDDANRLALAQVFEHPTFNEIPEAETRGKILRLWMLAGGDGRKKLPSLLDRRVEVGSNLTDPALLQLDVKRENTLLDNLLKLQHVEPHPDVFSGIHTQAQLFDDVITEILDPNGQVNQGNAGTCSPTSVQTTLITVNPSEYARLQLGLLSTNASAELANGDRVTVPPNLYRFAPSISSSVFAFRTFAEAGFQSAILRYGQAGSATPLPANPTQAQIQSAVFNRGLSSDQTERALEGIFDVDFETTYLNFSAAPANPTQAQFRAAMRPQQPAIRDAFLDAVDAAQQPILMATFWSQPYQFGHAVVALRREDGRIFFKNPQYRGSQPPSGASDGSAAANPPRQYVDVSQALESMTEADLRTWIKGFWMPEHAIG